ncbi:MAG: sensor histidine kinase [Anaerolineae bacterium]|jgi:two-component sensor histidine kinase
MDVVEARQRERTETAGRHAYRQLARHLTLPYMELGMPDGARHADAADWLVCECNDAMATLAGVAAPGELLGRPLAAAAPLLLTDIRLSLDAIGRTTDDEVVGPPVSRQGLVAFRVAPGRYGVLVEDAAVRQHAVEALARRARELATLHETLLHLNAETDLTALLSAIVARAAGLLDAPRGGLYLMREDSLLELAVSHGAPGAYIETTLELGEGVSGRAASEGTAVLVGAERSWGERDRAYADAPFGPAVAVPLRQDGRVIGALYVGDDERQLAYDHGDARLLSMFADQAALVIQRTRLLEGAQRDAAERAVLLREVNHRVKNNLTAIIGLLYAQERSVASEHREVYQEIVSTLAARVQALATAHELLSRSAWGPVAFEDLASQLLGSLLGSPDAPNAVKWRVAPSEVMLASDAAQQLAMVLCELATNVARHAADGRSPVSCEAASWLEGPRLVITFRDDGEGYPPSVLRGDGGVGLDLVRNLVKGSLRGAIRLFNEQGAVAWIELDERLAQEAI